MEIKINLFFFIILNFFIAYLILLNLKIIAKKLKLIDKPSKLNIHKNNTPLIGGFFIIFSLLTWLIYEFSIKTIDIREFLGYLFLFISSFFINFLDDKNNLDPLKRVLFLFLVSLISLHILSPYLNIQNIYFINFDNSIDTKKLNLILFSSCIVILQIILNLIDGINGLLKVYTLSILSIFFFKEYIFFENIIFFIIPTLIIISILNFKNYLFLGSTGNSLISIILSIIILNTNSINFQKISFEQVYLFFSFPILDTLRLFILRLFLYGNAFIKQKNHLHHFLFFKFGKINSIIIYIILSFVPIILFEFFNININICILFNLISYFAIYKFSK